MKNKEQRINFLIQNLFGEVGHEKGCFYLESWLNHNAVVEVVNDGGGVREVLSESTLTALIEKLEAIQTYKRYMKG